MAAWMFAAVSQSAGVDVGNAAWNWIVCLVMEGDKVQLEKEKDPTAAASSFDSFIPCLVKYKA